MFITKNSQSPYYQLIYFIDGKRTKKSTKKTNKREAEKFLKNFQPDISPVQQPQKANSIRLSKFKVEYLSYIQQTKTKSYFRSVKLSFNQFLSYLTDIPLSRINNKLIEKFIYAVHSNSKHAAALYYRTLKAAFNKAVDWDYLQSNPFTKVKLPKIPKSHPVFISQSEFQLIIDHTNPGYLKNIFFTAFYTGMRLGEIVNMKWHWVDLDKNLITTKCDYSFNTKSKKERIIPISKTLRQILTNSLPKVIDINKDDFVFTRINGIKLNEDFISKQFKNSVRAAKLNDKIHFHTLRHSFASNLVQNDVSLYVVKELLGHEDIKTTQIYSHLKKQNLIDAVNVI